MANFVDVIRIWINVLLRIERQTRRFPQSIWRSFCSVMKRAGSVLSLNRHSYYVVVVFVLSTLRLGS